MRRRIPALGAGILAAWSIGAFSVAADISQTARLGDEAMRVADFANAASYYAQALSGAAGDERASLLLKQIEAELGRRRITEARQLYLAWQKEYPGRSAGILPGRLLAAEGYPREAVDYLQREAARNTDVEQKSELLLAAAAVMLDAGEGGKAVPLLEKLEEKRETPHFFRAMARLYRVRALLQKGAIPEAEMTFQNSPYSFDYPLDHRKTALRIALARRDLKAFTDLWKGLPPPPRQDNELASLASKAAELVNEKSSAADIESALKLLEEAVRSASSASAVRECLRQKINFEEKVRPALAVETITQNLQEFDSAAERWTLARKAGVVLTKLGRHQEALEQYRQLESDPAHSLLNRRIAAKDGADAARRLNQPHVEESLLKSALELTRQISSSGGKQLAEARCDLGEFYLRTGKLTEAEKLFIEASAVAGPGQLKASGFLLQTFIREKNYQQALPLAEKLQKIGTPEIRDRAAYLQAVTLERLGRCQDALSVCQSLLRDSPKAADAPKIRLLQADLNMALMRFLEARENYLLFAADYPKEAAAPAALFGAVRAALLLNDTAGVQSTLALLQKSYPDARALTEAHLMLAGKYTAGGNFTAAAAELAAVETVREPVYRAEYLFRKAELLRREGHSGEARKLFHEVSQNYPRSDFAADADFQEGDLLFNEQRYQDAIEVYDRARKRCSTGVFPLLCRGHIAECQLFLAESSGNPELLKNALKEYERLAGESSAPAVQLRSLMRLMLYAKKRHNHGKVQEYARRMLYLARDIQRSGITPEYAEVRRALEELLADGRKRNAPSLIRHTLEYYAQMKLDTPEEIRAISQEWPWQEAPNKRSL